MLQFQPITPALRDAIHQVYYHKAKGHGSEYSFANLYFWGEQSVAMTEVCPLILSRFGSFTAYQLPMTHDLRMALELLTEDARERGIPLRLFGLTKEEIALLEALHPGRFRFHYHRDHCDYLYDIERLCQLSGKKLQAKRNHINRFMEAYPNHTLRTLTPDLLPLCREFAQRWYEEKSDMDFTGEQRAIAAAFAHFEPLGFEGLILEAEGQVMGFTMGNRIREDTFDVNFEKALASVNGAYPMINREFARRIHEKYPEIRWLNREDDMGIEGLRRAKESYYPDRLLIKYIAEEIV